jgi:hypothetical protein
MTIMAHIVQSALDEEEEQLAKPNGRVRVGVSLNDGNHGALHGSVGRECTVVEQVPEDPSRTAVALGWRQSVNQSWRSWEWP